MSKLILLILLVNITTTNSSDWKYYYNDNQATYYYDLSSLEYDKDVNSFTVWIWVSYPYSTQYEPLVKSYREYDLHKFRYYCDTKRYKHLYSETVFINKEKYTTDSDNSFYALPDEGYVNALFYKLCF